MLAATVGWVALTLVLMLFFRYAFGSFGILRAAPVESLATLAFFTGWAVFFVWMFVILPTYVFTPPSSFLWRWPVSTAGGFLIGMAIVASFSGSSLFSGLLWAVLFAGGPGALTGLFASLTAGRFHHVRNDPPAIPAVVPPLPAPPR